MGLSKFYFLRIAVFLFCCLIVNSSQGQKLYNYKISFSGPQFDRKNLSIRFYRGYQTVSIPTKNSDVIIGNSNSYLRFPIIECIFFSPKHKPTIHRFFVKNKNSKLELLYDIHKDDITVKSKSGLTSFDKVGQKEFSEFAKNEIAALSEFSTRYNNDFTNVDGSVLTQFDTYSQELKRKSFDFIKAYPDKLYSLWLFMNEIIGDPAYSKTDLKAVYAQYLKPKFRNTFEESYVLNKLSDSRLAVNTEAPYRDLKFKDLEGNTYTINSFKGKYLLINIWATWCVPCVAEMPTLKKLHSKYGTSLEFLSFSTDGDEGKLRRFISKENIGWKNVYNRSDICRIYGSDNGIPQVYLIDRNGVIIYSRLESKDYELIALEKLIENLNLP